MFQQKSGVKNLYYLGGLTEGVEDHPSTSYNGHFSLTFHLYGFWIRFLLDRNNNAYLLCIPPVLIAGVAVKLTGLSNMSRGSVVAKERHSNTMKFGIGQSAARIEDQQLLVGAGCFSDDVAPGQGLRIAFLRAPHGHARLKHLDVMLHCKLAGVRLVATQADLDADNVGDIECQFCPPLIGGGKMQLVSKAAMVRDIIRHAGEIIAMVVADTEDIAQFAIERIKVDYEPMPAVTDVYAAMMEDAPQLYECYPNNIAFKWGTGDLDGVDKAMKAAVADGHKIVEIDVVNNRVVINSMETRPMVASPVKSRARWISGAAHRVLLELLNRLLNACQWTWPMFAFELAMLVVALALRYSFIQSKSVLLGRRANLRQWCGGSKAALIVSYLIYTGEITGRRRARQLMKRGIFWRFRSPPTLIWARGCRIFQPISPLCLDVVR